MSDFEESEPSCELTKAGGFFNSSALFFIGIILSIVGFILSGFAITGFLYALAYVRDSGSVLILPLVFYVFILILLFKSKTRVQVVSRLLITSWAVPSALVIFFFTSSVH